MGKVEPLRQEVRLDSELAKLGIAEWDADLVSETISLTKGAAIIFGVDVADRITYQEALARIHEEDLEEVKAKFTAAHADPTCGFVRTKFRARFSDGSVRLVEIRGKIFRNDAGQAIRDIGVLIDVSSFSSASDVLDQNWSRMTISLHNPHVFVAQQDVDLKYIWVNSPRNIDAAQLIGKSDRDLLPAPVAWKLETTKRRVMAKGEAARFELDATALFGGGLYDLYIEPRRSVNGKIIGVTSAAAEIVPKGKTGSGSQQLIAAMRDREFIIDSLNPRATAAVCGKGLVTVCTSSLYRKLDGLVPQEPGILSSLAAIEGKRRFVAAKREVSFGEPVEKPIPTLLGHGWLYSYRTLASGERQVISFFLPGDIIRPSNWHEEQYHTVSDCNLCELDVAALKRLLQTNRRFADAHDRAEAIGDAMFEQRLLSLGRRDALARVAHLLLELESRLRLVGLTEGATYRCPLSQELIADALGLTNVHVSRTLKLLREKGCATFSNSFVTIENRQKLIAVADFDESLFARQSAKGSAPDEAHVSVQIAR